MSDEIKYPSTELAYQFAVDSYEIVLKRYDAIDGRIQTILSFWATISLAIPIGAKEADLKLRSPWFVLVIVTFLVSAGIGLYARLKGTLKAVHPGELYSSWLHLSHDDFRATFIYWAGLNYQTNKDLVERKWLLACIMSSLFLLQVLWLALWVVFPL